MGGRIGEVVSRIGYDLKYSITFIKDSFAKKGYKLLSKKYTNCKQHLDYICNNGHQHKITFDSWIRGKHCPYCKGTIKKTIEEIRKSFETEGYILLTNEYKNSKQKLDYICPVGHKHQIKWEKWHEGCRCFYCHGTPKKTIEEVKKVFSREGFTLLTKNYVHARQKLDYICPSGHHHSINWDNWREGYRCPHCHGNARRDIDDIRKEFESEGYVLLTKAYKNSDQKLKIKCPGGHLSLLRWRNWKYGIRCSICANEEVKRKAKKRWIDPAYQKKMAKAFAIKPNKPETALLNLLNQLFPQEYKYVGDFQFFLGGKNPDFMNVDGRKSLIELYGTYWHRNDDPQDRIDHFKQYGFSTLIVWENELKDQEALVNKLQKFHTTNHNH